MNTPRNTSNDGFRNKLEFYALTHFKPIWSVVQKNSALSKKANQFLVNSAVNKTKARPYAMSTLTPYTSWESLTDRTYHGRHLPVSSIDSATLKPVDEIVQLFKRPSGQAKLSTKSTLLFAYFAQWFTDGFLRTDRSNLLKNTSNHEIDLSPLYGLNPRYTRMLRSGQGGKLESQMINGEEYPCYQFDSEGKVKPEFAELPIVLPPDLKPELKPRIFAMGGDRANIQIGYVMLNTLFLREHNRISALLEKHNPNWDDERLFQTARNILIVMLVRLVIEEYINHISPYYFKLFMQPRVFSNSNWYRQNWICLEFNLLYRWHSLIPDKVVLQGQERPLDAAFWNNEYIVTNGLGSCFEDATLQAGCEIGLFNTPSFLLETEKASIELGRAAGLASYNDYRENTGLPRVTDFNQISGRPEVQKGLKEIYGHVDNIEFYVGLFAEDTRPNSIVAPLIGHMVAIDAFSQALTNPLLSDNVFNEKTFSPEGMKIIEDTTSLSQILNRNVPTGDRPYKVSMTQDSWQRL